jgi:hypothetical protein
MAILGRCVLDECQQKLACYDVAVLVDEVLVQIR